jgi:hypothetical protein
LTTTLPSPAPYIKDDETRQAFEILWKVLRELPTGDAYAAPTLAGAWVNTGGASTTAGYIKDPIGFVHLRGTVKTGAGAIFTLPTGYRPSATVEYAVPGDGAYAQVSVTSAGVVTQVVGTAVLGLSLDSITFKAA